jgi:type VI secretion system protein ImpA
MNPEMFNQLVAPIPGAHPGGEDISFLPIYDEVREARRADDPALTQGEWETELKTAQWPRVRQLCENILQTKSKDLQVACWYVDALTQLHGFDGLAFGFQVMEVLLTDFWEFLFPEIDEDGAEERAGKIAWLNKQLSETIRNHPLTSQNSGGYSWAKWQESRLVANLGLRDAAAQEQAVAEGKLAPDVFDKATRATGLPYYEALREKIRLALDRIAVVETHIDTQFGAMSPGLREVREATEACANLVAKIISGLGGHSHTEQSNAGLPQHGASLPPPGAVNMTPIAAMSVGQIRSRAEAIAALRQVAQFFQLNEPHSPVGLLAGRAARWAEMPLERWLAAVVKDEATLSQLRELLDIQSQ